VELGVVLGVVIGGVLGVGVDVRITTIGLASSFGNSGRPSMYIALLGRRVTRRRWPKEVMHAGWD
jgi:hypothetical protein